MPDETRKSAPMTGLSFEELDHKIRLSPYSQWVGTELVSCADGKCEVRIDSRDELIQDHGFLHGSLYGYLAVGRDVLKGRGTITFSVRDVFNSRIRRSIVDVPDFYSESEFQWRVRQFILTFNYRLRPGKSRRDERGRGEGGGMDGGGDMF